MAKNTLWTLLWLALVSAGPARADDAGRAHAENELLARPAIHVTVGQSHAEIVGRDNRALQAAVDYVGHLGGGVVEIGPGEYLMHDSLHLRSRVTVRGSGRSTILKKAASVESPLAADGDFGEAAIRVQQPEGFRISEGVYVSSHKAGGFLAVCATILNRRGNYLTLSRPLNNDCMMTDGAFAATVFPVISGYNLQDARVEDLVVDGNRAHSKPKVDGCRSGGIFLYRGDGVVIQDCVVRNDNGDGISFQQSNDVQVRDCVVEHCAGLGLHPGSGSQRPLVQECRSLGNDDDGLYICWRVRNGTFEDNVIRNNGRYGISIGHKDTDDVIRHNVIANNDRGGVYWRNEAEPMAAHRTHLMDNVVEDNGGWGLFIDGATHDTVLRHNTIRDTGSGRQRVGIRIGARAGRVTLEDNSIQAATPMDDRRPR